MEVRIKIEKISMETLVSNLRAYLQLSQAAFAKPIGLSPTHIARFEKGVSIPKDETIERICTVFGVKREYFYNDLPVEESVGSAEAMRILNPEIGIVKRLKEAREEKGWSQNELAKRSQVGQPIINRVEFGRKLTQKQGRKIAEALEVGFDWLMEGDEKKKLYPADQRMIDWLWQHEDVRKELWERMRKEEIKLD